MSNLGRVPKPASLDSAETQATIAAPRARRTLAPLPPPDPRERIPPATALPRLWRVSALAAYWGVSKPMIFKWLRAGELEAVWIGPRDVRVVESSAAAFLERRRRARGAA